MARYKCLTKDYPHWSYGEVYEGISMGNYSTVEYCAKINPKYWQLIEEEFVLPEKWCIKVDAGNKPKCVYDWDKQGGNIGWTIKGYIYNNRKFDILKPRNHTEITLDQFKQHVLKQDDMDKEIIGYKLKDKANEKVLRKALGLKEDFSPLFLIVGHIGFYLPKVKELEVFDWLEPVYKPKLSLPKINGYEGKKKDEFTVEYGCATLKVHVLKTVLDMSKAIGNRSIKSIKLSSNVEITINEIKQIIEYFNNI